MIVPAIYCQQVGAPHEVGDDVLLHIALALGVAALEGVGVEFQVRVPSY
jgi:hypothetical protein